MRSLTTWSAFAMVAFLFLLVAQVHAATPTSFCKCTCFKKSMIIPLDPPASSASKSSHSKRKQSLNSRSPFPIAHPDEDKDDNGLPPEVPPEKIPYKPKTCSDCNKSFCIDLGLPDCKDATEEDIVTTCFQRDSSKDEAVVFVFIIATVSLLVWALAKPFIGRWLEQAKERRSYSVVANSQDQ